MPSPPIPRAVALVLALFTLLPAPARSGVQPGEIPVTLTINHEKKGEVFAYRTAADDFLVRRADLERAGLRNLVGRTLMVLGEPYLSLASIRGLAFRFDEATVGLKIAASPRLLGTTVVDMTGRKAVEPERPTNGSVFLNYRAAHAERDQGAGTTEVYGETGARWGGWLLYTDGRASVREGAWSAVRYSSRGVYDWRDSLRRLEVGDVHAESGELGSALLLGGISFAKHYEIDPYLPKHPAFAATGLTPLPAEMIVSLDGIPIRREHIAPGTFDLRNLRSTVGERAVEITLRDIFGGETRLDRKFFFSDTLLSSGLSDYTYTAGWRRERFGQKSGEYGTLAFFGRQRYGLTDAITVGAGLEADDDVANAGPEVAFTPWRFGEVTASGRFSRSGQDSGQAFAAGYRYWSRPLDLVFSTSHSTAGYATVSGGETAARSAVRAAATVSAGVLGALGFSYARENQGEGTPSRQAAVSWSRDFWNQVSVYATFRHVWEETERDEFALTVQYSPWNRASLSARYDRREGAAATEVESSQSLPEGEGFGWRAVGRDKGSVESAEVDLQYNSRRASWRAQVDGVDPGAGERSWNAEVSVAGGLFSAGGSLGLSRPVQDAFAVVEVGGVPGVRVRRNGEEIGRTDGAGRIMIPRLDSFNDNDITIADKDVPMNYTIDQLTHTVSPAYRQGAYVVFQVKRFQAVSGFLRLRDAAGVRPLEHRELSLIVDGKATVIATAKGGEFYLENLAPGSYEVRFTEDAGPGRCVVVVPESTEVVVEIGEVDCALE